MRVFIRKTLNGDEYWDNEEKRTILLPTGMKPGFEITENPKSMLLSSDDTEQEGVMKELEDMTVSKLRKYAKDKDIEIPIDVRKKDDIVKFLYGNRSPDVE